MPNRVIDAECEPVLHIKSRRALEERMFYYNCQTEEELENLLWFEYGVTLIIDFKRDNQ